MNEFFNGDPENDEAMMRELLGDDDKVLICERRLKRYSPEQIERMFGIPKHMQKEGLFRRGKEGVTYLGPSVSMTAKEHYEKGQKLYLAGKLKDALACLDKCIHSMPNHADALIMRGMILGRKGELDAALKDLTKAIQLKPEDAILWCNRGVVWYKKDRKDKALNDLNEAIRLNPNFIEALKKRGALWDEKGEHVKALMDYDRAYILKLKDPDFQSQEWERGMSRKIRRREDDAPQTAEEYYERGKKRYLAGNIGGALSDLDECIHLKPDNIAALTNRASIRAKAGNLAGAIADYTVAIRIRPKDANLWYNRSVALSNKGQMYEAMDDLTEAIRLKPDFVEAWLNRGAMRGEKGEYFKAVADFDEVLRLRPNLQIAQRHRAQALLMIEKEKAGAIERRLVDSSRMVSIGYDKSSQILEIEFPDNRVYRYKNVPESVYGALMRAPSKYDFFNEKIRDVYAYSRVSGTMERYPVDSSEMISVGYDKSSQTLEIEFPRNAAYRYANVPESVYNDFMRASSMEDFFDKKIRGVYAYSRIS
ncbi:MAG: KTSC domain-containing protein [Hyphomicrobiales bacterium]|nr:KTSC domain-containing protein [Hyphomicrobiales bacterium]